MRCQGIKWNQVRCSVLLASVVMSGGAYATEPVKADNTKRNEAIVDSGRMTAQDQSNSKADIELAAKVRRAIVADSTLSTNAHNVKVITAAGVVHLKGPVQSDAEINRVRQIATDIAGAANVNSQLTVAAK